MKFRRRRVMILQKREVLPVKMDKILKQAQKMQAQMMKIQEELKAKEVEGAAGGGAVKVISNGQGEIVSIKISPDVVDPDDVEMLEDLVLAAISDALRKSKELADEQMALLTGGMGGLF